VREAFLKSENNSGQKVAVKVLKSKCTSKMISSMISWMPEDQGIGVVIVSVHSCISLCALTADINSSSDIEQCLKEAAYMKDFHHPNVIPLVG